MTGDEKDSDVQAAVLVAQAGSALGEGVADLSDEVEPASVRNTEPAPSRLTPPPKPNSTVPLASISSPAVRYHSSPRPPPPSKRARSEPPPPQLLVPSIDPIHNFVAPPLAEVAGLPSTPPPAHGEENQVEENEVKPSSRTVASPIMAMRIIVVGESPRQLPLRSEPELEATESAAFDGAPDISIEVDHPSPTSELSRAAPSEEIEEADADALLEQPRDKPPPPKRRTATAALDADRPRTIPPEKPKRRRPWWEEVFSEDFLRAERLLTDVQVKREVDFIENSLALDAGGSVLDLGCGAGQHAVELASRGYGVVAYDLSLDQLAVAADVAQERVQRLSLLQGDMRELAFNEMFDGLYCWNTTFGYFEEEKNFAVAQRMFQALKPGGRLVLDVANRDYLAGNSPCQVWYEGQRCVCMDDANLDFITSRLKIKRSVILDDGRTRECSYSLRVYGLHELGKLLHDVGFRIAQASGHPATPGVFFGQSSPRIIILAQKP